MPNENKVFYGLSNVHIVPVTDVNDGVPVYGTPFHFPGAVAWGEAPEGENAPFRADNTDYFVSAGNDGYTGDLEVARVIDQFAREIYGFLDGSNGEFIEVAKPEATPFAMIVQIEGDQEATRHVYPWCTAERASADHATTEEGAIEPGTETIPVACKPLHVDGIGDLVKYRVPASAANYDTILTTFTLPTVSTSA